VPPKANKNSRNREQGEELRVLNIESFIIIVLTGAFKPTWAQ